MLREILKRSHRFPYFQVERRKHGAYCLICIAGIFAVYGYFVISTNIVSTSWVKSMIQIEPVSIMESISIGNSWMSRNKSGDALAKNNTFDMFSFSKVSQYCGVSVNNILGTTDRHTDCLTWLSTTLNISNDLPKIYTSGSQALVFHTVWVPRLSKTMPLSYITSLLSVIATQDPSATIIIWTKIGTAIDKKTLLPKELWCRTEFRPFTEEILRNLSVLLKVNYTRFIQPIYAGYMQHAMPTGLTDLIRAVVVYIYGGVYFDLDVMFLRNLAPLLAKQFISRWSQSQWASTAVMHYHRNSTILATYMIHCCFQKDIGLDIDKLSKAPFHPHLVMECFDKAKISINDSSAGVLVYPSAFFYPLWIYFDTGSKNVTFMQFFNEERPNETAEEFFPGAFAYHQYYNWKVKYRIANNSLMMKFYRKYQNYIQANYKCVR